MVATQNCKHGKFIVCHSGGELSRVLTPPLNSGSSEKVHNSHAAADSNFKTWCSRKKKKKEHLLTLWSVQRIKMFDIRQVEESLIYVTINTLSTCMVKLQQAYRCQKRAEFRSEELAGHLSLLKMTHWNVSAVVWLKRVGQIVFPDILCKG